MRKTQPSSSARVCEWAHTNRKQTAQSAVFVFGGPTEVASVPRTPQILVLLLHHDPRTVHI